MEQERLDNLTEMRFRQLERLTSALIEGQQDTMQVLTEHSRRFDRIEARLENIETRMENIEGRMNRVEELLTLALDDLSFIKDILKPGE